MGIDVQEFDYLRQLIQTHTAIVIDSDKAYLAESRLSPLLRQEGCSSVQELIVRLRKTSASGLRRKVLDAMTNNETWFFRDCNPFEVLRDNVLPEMLQKRAAERKIVIWSAACSSGQEPYSIAMLLREHFNLPGWQFVVRATDISSEVLSRATRGRYLQHEVNRGLPTALLAKYLVPCGAEWEIKPEIKKMVTFDPINLAEAWEDAIGPVDVIFLRNVMIYFDLETRKQILARVHKVLKPGGYLFLGAAETTLNLDGRFERVSFDKASCYQVKKQGVDSRFESIPER